MMDDILKVYMFPIDNKTDSLGLGIHCPDPRERDPLPLVNCAGMLCKFLYGTFKENESERKFVACLWNKNKTVEENMARVIWDDER